jgi:segregation and condensation protein A
VQVAVDQAAVAGTEPPAGPPADHGFHVHLDVFDGPFDLLLSLIAKRRLDVTLVAIAQVTDEFIGYIRASGEEWDLDQASEFLVVAATLLDLKVARLLPSVDLEDEEDLALLEARDLLFARLLQYRAYKEIAAVFAVRMAHAARRFGRDVGLEPQLADLLPEVVLGIAAAQLANLATRAALPRQVPVIDVGHIHAPTVNVREQAAVIAARLRVAGQASFRALISDCTGPMEVVGRFLALLELYRESVVTFSQLEPLADLHIRWVGGDGSELAIEDTYDAVGVDTDAEASADVEPVR